MKLDAILKISIDIALNHPAWFDDTGQWHEGNSA